MKISGLCLALLSAVSFAAPTLAQDVAQSAVLDDNTAQAAHTPDAPALWRVADEDTTIYLFGTVHLLPEGIDWYTGPVREAFESSHVLVTELPMQPGDDEAQQQAVQAKGTLPEGTSLRSLLSGDDLALYEAALTDLDLPVSAFDRYEPWVVSISLALLPLMQEGYSAQQGVETSLVTLAGDEKQFAALETFDFQIDMLDTLPLEDQLAYLISAAKQAGEAKADNDAMIAEWRIGDVADLDALMKQSLEETPELAEVMLYARNANWAEWIDRRLDTPGAVFIAVGAGHLAGEKSVQDLLEKRGIAVTRLQ